jgi:hypothetical protein
MMAKAKNNKIVGILGILFVFFFIGLSISVSAQYNSQDQEIGRDGNWIAYACGVVWDTKAGLEWIAGPDEDTNWDEAKEWVDNLNVAGGGWRLPKIDELKTLYEKGRGTCNMTPLLGIASFGTTSFIVWSGEKDSLEVYMSAWYFGSYYGSRYWLTREFSDFTRVIAVRFRK